MGLVSLAVKRFEGMVMVLHHSSTIQPNYQAMMHCGAIRVRPFFFLSLWPIHSLARRSQAKIHCYIKKANRPHKVFRSSFRSHQDWRQGQGSLRVHQPIRVCQRGAIDIVERGKNQGAGCRYQDSRIRCVRVCG